MLIFGMPSLKKDSPFTEVFEIIVYVLFKTPPLSKVSMLRKCISCNSFEAVIVLYLH